MQENNNAIHPLLQECRKFMALYAYGEDLIAAWDAEPNGRYWCLECAKPVKVRKTKNKIPHFYHLQLSPSCRLYSKSEDHLLLQLQIQSLFPEKEAVLERIFPEIRRVSDLVWEKKKIAFEIQCSAIYPKECERRIEEYKSLGYQVVWILDDRAFNKRILRPAEPFLRSKNAYYAAFRRHTQSIFYDQFEIFLENKRVKKGSRIPIDLSQIHSFPDIELPDSWPYQIIQRIEQSALYFSGDLLDRARLSSMSAAYALQLQNWAALEIHFKEDKRESNFFESFRNPLLERLNALLADK